MAYKDEMLQLTDILAVYTHARFIWYLSGSPGVGPLPNSHIPIPLVVESEIMAMETAKAYKNRGMHESHSSTKFAEC
jgi:hypothetical protein